MSKKTYFDMGAKHPSERAPKNGWFMSMNVATTILDPQAVVYLNYRPRPEAHELRIGPFLDEAEATFFMSSPGEFITRLLSNADRHFTVTPEE